MQKTAGKGLTPQEEDLWQRWLGARDPEDRLLIYEHYAPWMRCIAAQMARNRQPLADWGDYLHFAAVGLLTAIDRYQPRDGIRFQAYAEHHLRGAILQGLACYRQDAPAMHRDRIAHHFPDDGSERHSLEKLMAAAVDLAFGFFLETGITDDSLPMRQDPYALHQQKQHVDFLAVYVERLPEREKTLVQMHYFDHLNFADIARAMQVSKPRITQLHAQALTRMRNWFDESEIARR